MTWPYVFMLTKEAFVLLKSILKACWDNERFLVSRRAQELVDRIQLEKTQREKKRAKKGKATP